MKPTINRNLFRMLKLIGSLVVLFSVSFLLGACQNSESSRGETSSSVDPADSIESADAEAGADDEVKPPEETFTDIRISAVGDIMMHSSQMNSAYNAETGSYSFEPVFEDVKPIIEEADLAIANFETTLGGPSMSYSGYPLFNAPDEVVDALKYAGFDVLLTANNHSLDTRSEGLKRTAQVVSEKGLDPVGTYESNPESRVLLKDVEGVKIAIIGYTEHVNGLEASYSSEELNSMINLISEERILADIKEAKVLEPDLILAYMHWGNEYAGEPSTVQSTYAELMTREGVDIILGSHPHVIQGSEFLEVDGNEAFVAYSLGNFVSNQRMETLGEGFEATEDGVITNLHIQKNDQTGETTLQEVEFIPTWVYRNREDGAAEYTYRILPIQASLNDSDLPESYIDRMNASYKETMSRIGLEETQEN